MIVNRGRHLSIALVGVATFIGGISMSYADHKTYAGAECVRRNESIDPASYISAGQRLNPSKTRLRVVCPAVKDRGGNLRSSWIRVVDNHPKRKVCARIAAGRRLKRGVIHLQGREKCTKRQSGGRPVRLVTGRLRGVPSGAHYYFNVKIPRRHKKGDSGVVSYRINEQNRAD